MADEYIQRIERFFNDHEVEDYRFELRSKHVQVKGSFRGKPFCVTFPKTGSDWRGPLNAVTTLRHELGLVGAASNAANDNKQHKPVKRAKRRRTASRGTGVHASIAIESPVVRPDHWLARLAIIRDRLAAAQKQPATTSDANDNHDLFGSEPHAAVIGRKRVRLATPWLGKRERFTTV